MKQNEELSVYTIDMKYIRNLHRIDDRVFLQGIDVWISREWSRNVKSIMKELIK